MAVTVVLTLLAAAEAAAQTLEPIRYVVRFPAPQTNYAEVTATIPADGRADVDLMMAVWTPGSYLVREYARHVEDVAASNGGVPLAIQKTQKNRWRVTTNGARAITLTYRVFAHEMTVRSDWVEDGFAMLNGAPTFITLADLRPRAHDVRLELPGAWRTSVTGLPDSPEGGAHHYRAPDYDTLVDCPIVAGNPAVHRFTVDGKPHLLVDVGEAGVFDGARAARDLEKVVQTAAKLWRGLPYDKYVFFNVLTETGGGLEHENSVMMMASRWATSTRERYLAWLSTASHEFFHLWNVKRLRPVELGPFDYEHEVYIAEGLTDYYADVILARAGLITAGEYFGSLSSAVASLQATPGRLTQPVESASFDAWIKQYRPDENAVNSAISYYTKGAVIGFVLDARVRQATAGARTLDDVMPSCGSRFSGIPAREATRPRSSAPRRAKSPERTCRTGSGACSRPPTNWTTRPRSSGTGSSSAPRRPIRDPARGSAPTRAARMDASSSRASAAGRLRSTRASTPATRSSRSTTSASAPTISMRASGRTVPVNGPRCSSRDAIN
ncbi:MAG: hypothetical protein DMF85_16850 [Acidobacteria bacterium]|nr:MAG: hypothetical protein DMF85_16850 [Acidobacteriota bacterium]